MEKVFDVIIAGAGPGGSSLAAWLGRKGVSTLLLDRAHFPRDKVCGDGLTPKALYWLEALGCVDEVLDQSNSYLTHGDVFIGGVHVLTGAFPQSGPYPGFSILLERKKLDQILVRHAVRCGARFRPGCQVKRLTWDPDGVRVEASSDGTPVSFKAKVVVGADGANSIVSRAIGNRIMDGATAVSMRGYFENVRVRGSKIRLYFDEEFFPGYGWLFVDDAGKANVGIGYVFDENFPLRIKLKTVFERFLASDLKGPLARARPLGKAKGGWACYYKPSKMTADRVLLVGDAANLADPINGGGIHMAMESAYAAAQVLPQALQEGDLSAASLRRYEQSWDAINEPDWRTGDLLLTIARNPNLRELYLYLIRTVAGLAKEDPRFQEFCGGLFNGVTPARKAICPSALLEAAPLDPGAWRRAALPATDLGLRDLLDQSISAARCALKVTERMMIDPVPNIRWFTDILSKTVGIVNCYGA